METKVSYNSNAFAPGTSFRDWLQLHYLTTVTLDPVYAKEVSSSRITFVTKPCCFLISGNLTHLVR
jgi:hypothetical protein